MNQPLKKVIKISGFEMNVFNGKNKYGIKDETGKTYGLWELKKDNTERKAYTFFKSLPNNGVGQIVQISYNETPNPKSAEYPYKDIIGMELPQSGVAEIKKPMDSPKLNITEDNRAWGMVRHGFATIAYEQGKPLNEVIKSEIDDWTAYVMTGKLPKDPAEQIIDEAIPSPEDELGF